jgi:hypothetical protein
VSVAEADDPAWDDELAALSQGDGPAPPVIMDGLVDVLRRWSRSWERPVAVVGMPVAVLRRPRDQHPRRASGCPAGEPLADTWLVRCGRLPHRFLQRNKAAARPATVFAMLAVGLPNIDRS